MEFVEIPQLVKVFYESNKDGKTISVEMKKRILAGIAKAKEAKKKAKEGK